MGGNSQKNYRKENPGAVERGGEEEGKGVQVKSSITTDYLNPQQKSTSCRLTGLGMCVCVS